jgi:DNA-binding transcriptional ArsR family regulator
MRHSVAAVHLAASAPVFAALGDATRLLLVARLCDGGPSSIVRLSERLPVTRQAVTKHLQVLAAAGLIRSSRRGRERVWELQSRRIEDARKYLDLVSTRWDGVLDRLKKHVEP